MPFDAIVPFSMFLNEDMTPDSVTKARLDLAIDRFKKEEAPLLFLPGGDLQKLGITLAKSMRTYAINRGLSPENILIEERSLDTIGQVLRTRVILEKREIKSILWVSDKAHMPRVRMIIAFIWPNIKSEFATAKTSYRGEDEKHSIELLKKTYEGIKTGDLNLIADCTAKKHRLYKKISVKDLLSS